MRGHIKKRSRGSWAIVIDLSKDPVSGNRRQQWITVKGTKRDAERRLAELLHQVDTGSFVQPTKHTLGELLEQWLDDYARPNVGPMTFQAYEHMTRKHLIPDPGSVQLSELRPQHLQAYYAAKLERGRLDGKGGLSPRTVRHHHITLHGALQSAVRWGLMIRNPADAVTPPRSTRGEIKTFDEAKLRTFLEAARETPYYALFYISLFTGLRRSELLGLRWDDVDFDLGSISVNRGLQQVGGKTFFRAPKSSKGRRQVALPPSVCLLLRQHRNGEEAQRTQLGFPQILGGDLVFARTDGSHIPPDNPHTCMAQTRPQAWIPWHSTP